MSIADDDLLNGPEQPARHPIAEKVIQITFDATENLLRSHGAVPPPSAHLFMEEYDQPYVGWITTRPFRYGADAAAAIARLGLLPSVLLANRVVLVWEHADLLTGLTEPGQNYPHAMVAVEATFTTHTMTWRPFTVKFGPTSPNTGLPVCYPTFAKAQLLSAPALPHPVSDAIATWRALRMDADMDATFAALQAEGYRINLNAPSFDEPVPAEDQSYELAGPPPVELIDRAHAEVTQAFATRSPSSFPDAGYLQGTIATLAWALGRGSDPFTRLPSTSQVSATQAKRLAQNAYELMHRLGPNSDRFQFVVGVENTASWVATGTGIYLG